mgnify:CR=1 FL=1
MSPAIAKRKLVPSDNPSEGNLKTKSVLAAINTVLRPSSSTGYFCSLVSNSQLPRKSNAPLLSELKEVFKLEQFYGDKELGVLLEHTRVTIEILEDYQTAVLELEPVDVEETNEEDNINDEETEEGIQKDVLYAGTRRRNS